MLERLDLVRSLGRGMMGEVFEARERGTNARFVVKRMRPQAENVTDMARFRRESQVMRQLRHPNIMPVVFVGADAAPPYYVMPFRSGETLSTKRDRGRMSASAVARIGRDVCAGLAEAHKLGIVHRDVKPGNIFIEDGGRAVLLDFGLAKDLASADMLTAAGTAVGTPAYMAPEQCRGEAVEARTDVYSLGVTLLELLLGKNPFQGKDLVETLRRQLVGAPRRLDELLPTRVGPELGRLIDSMLLKMPADRPSTKACLDAFAAICAELDRRAACATQPRVRPVFQKTVGASA